MGTEGNRADTGQTNCLTETLFDEALERAKYCDEYLAKEGKPLGPLHGLPISLKVTNFLILAPKKIK